MDENGDIIMETDASQTGFGAYLYQRSKVDGTIQPIAFISKSFAREQLRWSTPEKEAYAIFYAFKKLDYLLRGVHFLLRTDHKNLTFINLENSGKVCRWKIEIQEYDFDIEHVPGLENIVADVFSWLHPTDINVNQSESVDEVNMLYTTLEIDIDIELTNKLEIRKVHNLNARHFGVDKTMEKLTRKGLKWPYMQSHVEKYIRECPCCQKCHT